MATEAWDGPGFAYRLAAAKAGADQRAVRNCLREVSDSNYALRFSFGQVPRTDSITHQDCLRLLQTPTQGVEPRVSFVNATTGQAISGLAARGRMICALNFANGTVTGVGGGYKNGAEAQEEELCRQFPTLYTSLNQAKGRGCYPFGPSTCTDVRRPQKYADVLYTPGLVLARGDAEQGYGLLPRDRQIVISMVSAAAPNVNFAQEIVDEKLVSDAIRTIFLAPKVHSAKYKTPDVTTLVLGAWGCGAFGGNPVLMASLFANAIKVEKLGHFYSEIYFAIPAVGKPEGNAETFLRVFNEKGLKLHT
eukprot:gnl/TRDRNA2_/TRDRNA2_196542_c0_seq1.p1 gnl/TRDRNA2_/TRDRNA2_196542_c0~~gnl/TRDRNA2_/TRDRNA2_196542_c0_seq1.p1  ORF type:complete len:306 (-),score=43.62 gnl/TRDRNA2_/TRDRNA2_196542_c0_seq1:87-1004(-)